MSALEARLFDSRTKGELWDHCANEHHLYLLESEMFELWLVATKTIRAKLTRLNSRSNGDKVKPSQRKED